MSLEQFPFSAVTISSLVVHIASWMVARLLKPVWKGGTCADIWWTPAIFLRLFTVKETDVQMPLAWRFIVISRVAFTISAMSLMLDLCIN